jgi:predicted Zn finger-like uncharacterized protein
VIVICPKCKVKLKVAEDKIAPGGTRFKCPKCATVLLVRRPAPKMVSLDRQKVLVAHQEQSIVERINNILTKMGYRTVLSYDGVDTMIKALKELPFIIIADVALPKIYGFEVAKRLKARSETKDVKVLLISSIYDKKRYKREPASLYGADDYIEEHTIEELLEGKIEILKEAEKKSAPAPQAAPPPPAPEKAPEPQKPAAAAMPPHPEPKKEAPARVEAPKIETPADPAFEKARRLARTIISDIYIYDPAKFENAIKSNTFKTVFASELAEGIKLFKNRVSPAIIGKADFFKEAMEEFLRKKKVRA